ncbi:ribonucleotide reductase inhibitor-domain-containing protein [Podospora fimiseda]|uniref:Ribonucleotide reductase inhibitor-domain-containing protein n=1 Tax=Podospora fimiseda TaxID=252190 RepID=A0AAN7H331_9PEZI|nr:ribonucleotide reductase inhibitor-domain-containing protein [Podospora fimiseda]
MSNPRAKRQFAGAASDPAQRQITSFFSKSSSQNSLSQASAPLDGPILPAQVQSNLINVGMRVRKAVPEGYKTGNQYSAFKLWEEDSTPAPTVSSTTSTSAGSAARELVPFCGIHKVGGMDVQPVVAVAPTTSNDFDDTMPIPGLSNSQESILSNTSISSATEATGRANLNGKRRFSDAGEDEDGPLSIAHDGPFRLNTDLGWFDAEISPRSLAPDSGWENNGRVLAVPKGRHGSRKTGAVGQENVRVVVPDGNDFEEANFLVDEDMDMGY